MTIVPFMLEWIVQWNGYDPAALKTRLCGASPVMFADIVHGPRGGRSRSWTRFEGWLACGIASMCDRGAPR
jgi:hypothetical protein